MRQVVFIYNELLDKKKQKLAKLPLDFICFAYIKNADLYDIKGKYYSVEKNSLKRTKTNNKVFGALYILHNSEHYMRTLDACMTCSKGLIGTNHQLDINHRVKRKAVPIHFQNIENFLKNKYNEGDELNITTYLANTNHKMIKDNVLNTVRNREVSGLDVNNFVNLLIERCD